MSKKYRSADDHPYWETVKRLPTFRAKVEYTWENWRVHILGVAFLIVLVSSVAISNYVKNIPSYLTGAYVNLLLVDQHENYQEDYLDRAFLYDHLGISEDQRLTMRCVTDMPLDLSGASDSWLQENTQETWGDAVVTKPVSVSKMHQWLKDYPDAFLAAVPNA